MKVHEFLIEDSQGNSYLVKNNISYMPLEKWMKSEVGAEPEELDEADDDDDDESPTKPKSWTDDILGTKTNNNSLGTVIPDKEFGDYLGRIKADQVQRVAKSKGDKRQGAMQKLQQQWTDIPEPRNPKERKKDYFTKPYIHGSSIKFMDGSHEIDVEAVKRIIKTRPKNLLKQNEKMEHSGGGDVYLNVGLPALRGIVVNEQTNDIIFVNTCPGAGACQTYCYAKKGNYILFKANWEKAAKTLNLLINNPAEFENMMCRELAKEEAKWTKQGFDLSVRWHDAGDFFSEQYLELAYSIARKFPNIRFYCYTKLASVALGEKPENFIANWSEGASPDQNKIVKKYEAQFGELKRSIVVPKAMFDKYTEYRKIPDPNKPKKSIVELAWNSEGAFNSFKRDLVLNYDVPKESIITYHQLVNTPRGNEKIWNVIIRPGDGDSGANRNDVDSVFLLFH